METPIAHELRFLDKTRNMRGDVIIRLLLDTSFRHIDLDINTSEIIRMQAKAMRNRNKSCKGGPVRVMA